MPVFFQYKLNLMHFRTIILVDLLINLQFKDPILLYSKFPLMESLNKNQNILLFKYQQLELALDLFCDFSKNEAFIIFIASKCCNFQEIKSEILIHAFSCDQEKINVFMKSNYFVSQTQNLRRRCAQLKCQLKNQRLKWKVNEESQIQNILIKHIIKALTFRNNRQLSIKFLRMELKNFRDPNLSKLFHLGMNYDWISFLVYVILKNNMDNANLLSKVLEIPETKLENFYQLRKLALVESQNQDSNRYRRLFLLWDSDEDRVRIQDQKQKFLVQLAIKKYGPKLITKQNPKINSNQIKYQQTQEILYFQNTKKQKWIQQKRIKICKSLQEQLKQHQTNNFRLKECDIYDSDDEMIQNKGSFINDNFDISFFNESYLNIDKPYECPIEVQIEKQQLHCQRLKLNLQTTVYSMNDPKQVQFKQKASRENQNKIMPFEVLSDSISCGELQSDQNFRDNSSKIDFLEKINKFKSKQIVSLNVQQESEMYLKVSQSNSGHEMKKLSIEDQIILYLLYQLQNIEGIMNTQAELLLERPKQQLVNHFIQNNVVNRFLEIKPQIQEYILQFLNSPQDIDNQKHIYLISLIHKLSSKQQQILWIKESQQIQTFMQTVDFRTVLGNLNSES